MTNLQANLRDLIRSHPIPPTGAAGGAKKNYTEALSHHISTILAAELDDSDWSRLVRL